MKSESKYFILRALLTTFMFSLMVIGYLLFIKDKATDDLIILYFVTMSLVSIVVPMLLTVKYFDKNISILK